MQDPKSKPVVWAGLESPANANPVSWLSPPSDTVRGRYAWWFSREFFSDVEPSYVGPISWFVAQLPPEYVAGSSIVPKVRWFPTEAGAKDLCVRWALEYAWLNRDQLLGATTIVTSDASSAATATEEQDESLVRLKPYTTEFAPLVGGGKNGAGIIFCRFYRNATHKDDKLPASVFASELSLSFTEDGA